MGQIYGAMTKNKEKGSQAISHEPAYLLAPRVRFELTT